MELNYILIFMIVVIVVCKIRAKISEAWQLPKSAHLYVVPFALYKIHSQFDDVFRRILRADKLAYFIFIGNKKNSKK